MNIPYPHNPTADPIERLRAMRAYLAQLEEQAGCFAPYFLKFHVGEIEEPIHKLSYVMTHVLHDDPVFDMLRTMPRDKMLVLLALGHPFLADVPATDRLDALQKAVCGRIEMVEPAQLASCLRIYVNEEGAIKRLPWNFRLTPFLALPRPFYGNAVSVWEKDEEEEVK